MVNAYMTGVDRCFSATQTKEICVDREVEQLADRVAAAKKVSPFLNTEHAAFYIGLSASGLEKMRRKGRGPKFRHHGRHIRYHIDDLDAWSMERGDDCRIGSATDAA
jgi:hypothetical protein